MPRDVEGRGLLIVAFAVVLLAVACGHVAVHRESPPQLPTVRLTPEESQLVARVLDPVSGEPLRLTARASIGRWSADPFGLSVGKLTYTFEIVRRWRDKPLRELGGEVTFSTMGELRLEQEWDGRDQQGELLPSGVYRYRVNATLTNQLLPTPVTVSFLFPDPIVVALGAPSSRRVCVLAGDGSHNDPDLTGTSNVYGTDLGFTFDVGDVTYMLFGDTWTQGCDGVDCPTPPFPVALYKFGDDAIATFTDTDPTDCIDLSFVSEPPNFLPLTLEHPTYGTRTLGALRTPLAGFHVDGRSYAFIGVGDSPGADESPVELGLMDEGSDTSFTTVGTIPSREFINLAVATSGPSTTHGDQAPAEFGANPIFVWGRDSFVKFDPFFTTKTYLLYLKSEELPGSLGEGLQPHYYAGLQDGSPLWSDDPDDAQPVIDPEEKPVSGQVSVSWNPYLEKWLMLYGGRLPQPIGVDERQLGIYARFGDHPWGPWSNPVTIFNPHLTAGFCSLIYHPDNALDPSCVQSEDYPIPENADRVLQGGAEYGAAIIDRYTKPFGERGTIIYWTMSTFNPYRVLLMESTITEPLTREWVPLEIFSASP